MFMAETRKFAPLEEVRKEIEASFSIDAIKIKLESLPKEQELVTMLQKVEDLAFNDNGEITPEGQDDAVAELVVGICKEALAEFSKIEEIVNKNSRGQAASMFSGEDFSPEDISGAVDSSKTKELKNSLEALNNLIYSYLHQYAEQGYLSVEDMRSLGISEKDIKAVENKIEKQFKEDLKKWKEGGAESAFPALSQLKIETEKEAVTSQEAENQARVILDLINSVEGDLKAGGVVGEKYQFIEDSYLKTAKERQIRLNKIKDELEGEETTREAREQKSAEVEAFRDTIKDFIDVVKTIPFSRKEIVTIMNDDGVEEPHNPIDKKNPGRFGQQKKELKRRKVLLINEKQKAESSGVLKKKDSSDSASAEEINRVIDEVLRTSGEAEKRVEQLIKEAETPPIDEMSLDDLAAELIGNGYDPYFYEQMKSGAATDERAKALSDAFKKYWERNPESTPEEELNRVVQITKVQLHFLSSQLQEEPGMVSRERTQLWKEAIKRQMRRRELLMATTYHPEWGEETREMMEWSFKMAALRPGQILVKRKREKGLRAGEDVLVAVYPKEKKTKAGKRPRNKDINEESLIIRDTDMVLVRRYLDTGKDADGNDIPEKDRNFEDVRIPYGDFKPGKKQSKGRLLEEGHSKMFYGTLAKETGEYNLTQELKKRFPEGNPQALEFAISLFGSFDLLTISLGELQKNTMTRGHNADTPVKDRAMFADPLAAAMHRAFRYWNEHEWSLRALLFLEDVNNGDARYGIHDNGKNEKDQKSMKNHTWLAKLQKMLLKHQSVFYDTKSFAGKIALPEFCETTGINTYDFLTLHPAEQFAQGNEALEMPDGGYIIHDGRKINEVEEVIEEKKVKIWRFENGDKVEKDLIPKGENIAVTKWYELAEENGFTQLLELTFKRMPVLSDDDIFRKTKDGSKGGVLTEWLATAGRAKMFPGNHLKNYFEPLLANFVLRIFQQYRGRYNRDLRGAMFKEMISALEASAIDPAGLNGYAGQVVNVINSLCEKDIFKVEVYEEKGEDGKEDYQEKQVVKTGNKAVQNKIVKPWDDKREKERNVYMDAWYRWKNHGQAPPIQLLGVSLDGIARPFKSIRAKFVGKNPEEKEFMAIINGDHAIPDLVERTGDLMKKADKDD